MGHCNKRPYKLSSKGRQSLLRNLRKGACPRVKAITGSRHSSRKTRKVKRLGFK